MSLCIGRGHVGPDRANPHTHNGVKCLQDDSLVDELASFLQLDEPVLVQVASNLVSRWLWQTELLAQTKDVTHKHLLPHSKH